MMSTTEAVKKKPQEFSGGSAFWLLWLWLQMQRRFHPWRQNFCVGKKKKEKKEGTMMERIGGAEMWSLQNQHTWINTTYKQEACHHCRGPPQRVRGLSIRSGSLAQESCTRKMNPQNFWLWKMLGLMFRKDERI